MAVAVEAVAMEAEDLEEVKVVVLPPVLQVLRLKDCALTSKATFLIVAREDQPNKPRRPWKELHFTVGRQ